MLCGAGCDLFSWLPRAVLGAVSRGSGATQEGHSFPGTRGSWCTNQARGERLNPVVSYLLPLPSCGRGSLRQLGFRPVPAVCLEEPLLWAHSRGRRWSASPPWRGAKQTQPPGAQWVYPGFCKAWPRRSPWSLLAHPDRFCRDPVSRLPQACSFGQFLESLPLGRPGGSVG